MIELVVILVGVAAGVGLAYVWARTFGELAWMLAMRPKIVMPVMIVHLCVAIASLHFLLRLPYLSPTLFCIALALMPIVGRRIANFAAWCRERVRDRKRVPEGANLPEIQGFIFAMYQRQQDAVYEAPQITQ